MSNSTATTPPTILPRTKEGKLSSRSWQWRAFVLKTTDPETERTKRRRVLVYSPFRDSAHFGVGCLEGEATEAQTLRLSDWMRKLFSPRVLPASELASFFEAMGSGMTRSGNAGVSLEVAARVAKTPLMRGHIAALRHLVGSGYTLADAMKQLPGFSRMHVAITAAGEDSGNVGENYLELARRLQSSVALGRTLIANLIYPSILLVSALSIAVFLGVGVVPKYAKLYTEMGADLPWVTKLFREFGELILLRKKLLVALLLIANPFTLLAAARAFARTEIWHRVQLHLPLFGPIAAQLALARALQIYSLLSEAGLSAKVIFELVGAASGNSVVRAYFDAVYRRVYAGDSDAEAMAKEWPRLGDEGVVLAGKISIGRIGGGTSDLMRSLAKDYQSRAETTLTILPQVISVPVMILMAIILIPAVLAITLPLPTLIAKQLQLMATR